MASESGGLGEPGSGDAPIFVVLYAGSEPTTALREAVALRGVFEALAAALLRKGIVARPSPDNVRVVEAPARRRAAETWRHPLSIVILAVLVLVASAILAPSRAALAEATLGEPIPIALNPFGIDVNPATNRIYAASLGIGGAGKRLTPR